MRIDHAQYRSFETSNRVEPPCGFIDGDLIESILDMNSDEVHQIVNQMKVPIEQGQDSHPPTVKEVLKLVEDLARVH
ncbi:hypothetical protein AB6A40_004057 [Gnathostoma spinigerum]|uniref:Uncharacterized protein n=1 Tax=Gnathostoma spinigerum TaxID=75299 RepID=A0ABD6EBC5_9BILA